MNYRRIIFFFIEKTAFFRIRRILKTRIITSNRLSNSNDRSEARTSVVSTGFHRYRRTFFRCEKRCMDFAGAGVLKSHFGVVTSGSLQSINP